MQQWECPTHLQVLLEMVGIQLHVNSQQLENIPIQHGLPLKMRLEYLICKYKEQEEKNSQLEESSYRVREDVCPF